MSCKLTMDTAFQDIEILKIALEKCNIKFIEKNNKIIIPAWHYYGDSFFEKSISHQNKLYLIYDEDIDIDITRELNNIEQEYSKLIEYYANITRYRDMHEENLKNKALKQKQEQEQIAKKIIEEAKLNNYQYSQTLNEDGSINIVLVRHI